MRVLAGGRAWCCVLFSGMAQCLPIARAQSPQPPELPQVPPVLEGAAATPREPALHLHLDAPRRPRAELIEVPSTALLGKPSRPHHALGFQSELMHRWTRELGLDTERCMAPMLRLYSRVGRSASPTSRASNDLQSTFWVQARCSLR